MDSVRRSNRATRIARVLPRLMGACLLAAAAFASWPMYQLIIPPVLAYPSYLLELPQLGSLVTWVLLLVAGVGLLRIRRWGFIVAYFAAVTNIMPGFSFEPIGMGLADLVLPPDTAWAIGIFGTNLAFMALLVWCHMRLPFRSRPDAAPARADSPEVSDPSPAKRRNRFVWRTRLLASAGVLIALWLATWVFGIPAVEDRYTQPPAGRQLNYDPGYLRMFASGETEPWWYRSSFSPAPFVIVTDYSVAGETFAQGGRGYSLWFFGMTHFCDWVEHWQWEGEEGERRHGHHNGPCRWPLSKSRYWSRWLMPPTAQPRRSTTGSPHSRRQLAEPESRPAGNSIFE